METGEIMTSPITEADLLRLLAQPRIRREVVAILRDYVLRGGRSVLNGPGSSIFLEPPASVAELSLLAGEYFRLGKAHLHVCLRPY